MEYNKDVIDDNKDNIGVDYELLKKESFNFYKYCVDLKRKNGVDKFVSYLNNLKKKYNKSDLKVIVNYTISGNPNFINVYLNDNNKYVIESDLLHIIEILHELGADFSKKSKYGNDLFYYALRGDFVKSHLKVMRFLKNIGFNLSGSDTGSQPFIFLAVAVSNYNDVIDFLISNNVDVNKKDSYGNTFLHYASKINSRNSYNALKYLIGNYDLVKKDTFNSINNDGMSVLVSFLYNLKSKNEYKVKDIVLFLLDTDKFTKNTLNLEDNYGMTPLILCVINDYPELVNELIKMGANPYIKNKNGDSAFDIAKKQKNKKIISIIESFKSFVNKN